MLRDGYYRRKVVLRDGNLGGVVLPSINTRAGPTGSNAQHGHEISLSRQRLVASSPNMSRAPSPALGHSHATAPELSVSADTNSGNYYFSYPAAKMGTTDFEDQLYKQAWFRTFMRFLMTSIFVLCTVAACYGWAF